MLLNRLRATCVSFGPFLFISISIFVLSIRVVAQSQQTATDDRGSLSWRARQATEGGKTAITIETPDALWAQPVPLREALAHTSLTLATLVASETTHTDYEIITWRKYRILERLSSQPSVRHDFLPESVPSSLMPIEPGEFVIPEMGGTVDIDGVTITTRNSEVHVPSGDKRHLMFLLFRASGALAVSNYGPHGQFSVDDTDNIHAWVDADTNPLRSEILDRTGGKLAVMRGLASKSAQQRLK
jgi:hypothetical protein